MGLTYKDVKAVADAYDVIASHIQMNPWKQSGRVYKIHHGSWIVYSQQQIIVHPLKSVGSRRQHQAYDSHLPVGVTRKCFFGPYKEYLTFEVRGTPHYYLVPDAGLRLVRKGKSYTVANQLVDYKITIDKTRAKTARASAEDLIEYISAIWNIQSMPERGDRPEHTLPMPGLEDREAWHAYLVSTKYPRVGNGISKSTLLKRIRDHFTHTSLAYMVEVTPDTTTSHTSHWGKLPELRAAGMLTRFEDNDGYRRH